MKSRDLKTPILEHAVFLFQNCQSTVSVACLANHLVSPKFVQGTRTETLATHR